MDFERDPAKADANKKKQVLPLMKPHRSFSILLR